MTFKIRDVTGWISGQLKPVRVGVYQRMFPYGVRYSRWTGVKWMYCCFTPEEAERIRWISSAQNLPWRGKNFDTSRKDKK